MKYTVTLYYTGFYREEIEAANENEAQKKASDLPIDYEAIISTLQPWEEAYEIEKGDKIAS
jgi:hypothetical protein